MLHDQIPILIPLPPDEFWGKLQELVRAEIQSLKKAEKPVNYETPGLTKKPLYKSIEVCAMLSISRQTLHTWTKEGILKPYKIKSRLFYLAADIDAILLHKASK